MLIRLTPKHTIGSLAAETRCRHARRCPAPRGSALSGFTARVPAPLSCDAACAAYLEAIRWRDGFVCGWCGEASAPYRFANRPQVLRCRKCQRDNALTAGTVMERTHTPLSIWFWAAYLVSSHTPGISAVQFQRQLGLNRYETAFQILHKLRAGMVRPDRDRIGGQPRDHVEIDESWVGGRTRGEGRGVHDQSLVIAAVGLCRIVRQNRSVGLSRRRSSPGSWW